MTVQLNIRITTDQKKQLMERAKNEQKTVTTYILDKTLFEEKEVDNPASSYVAEEDQRIDKELYEALIKQLDRKDEQIINLQKIIYNKEMKLIDTTPKKTIWDWLFSSKKKQ